MGLTAILKFITNHPLNRGNKFGAVMRFVRWQINTRLNPYPVVYQFTDRALLIVKKGMSGATGNLYCGLHEFNDMGFLLHFLRKDDLFVDIGANIGSYTVLSAGHVGAQTISVEPVPATFGHLVRNIGVNQVGGHVQAHNIALGAQPGFVEFTSTLDTVNHVATSEDKDKIKVEMRTLDGILTGRKTPALLKIDVEGFETEVINGAKGVLADKGLKAIIIELNNSGARYGYDDKRIHETFLNAGFEPYLYDPLKRSLTRADTFGFHNTIYIRDIEYVTERVRKADKVTVRGRLF
jgi:FkbM family methyltransferase